MPQRAPAPRQRRGAAARRRGASGGSTPVLLGEGDHPVPSPDGSRVAFEKDNEIWVAPIDGSKPASRMFFARGRNASPVWSPDGRTLAFVTTRGSLGYIGLYSGEDQPLRYLSPSNALDEMPRWSPDGTPDRVRAPPGPRRSGRAAARSAAAAVVDLGRRREDGRGAGSVARTGDAAGFDAEHAGRPQSPLG